ncbi:hypothetical protein BC938DRAFT_471035 [Jimgerdemannia flammicorona]|uniref:Uncharacterized protein n=1 Tax=Jimgerdemannia flammicorona TaxID=994334 RepID=A0A433QUV0_9FUNG|nr:hypothetical protein BC938DRAFT_471035 [Jimgerdemannia flammicorona]
MSMKTLKKAKHAPNPFAYSSRSFLINAISKSSLAAFGRCPFRWSALSSVSSSSCRFRTRVSWLALRPDGCSVSRFLIVLSV